MPLLTDVQRERLITREEKKATELEAYKKRHNDQVVVDKLGDFIDSIPDALLILKHMPPGKIAKKLRLEQIPAILDLVEVLLKQIDPWAIGEHEDGRKRAFRVWGSVVPASEPGKCTIDSASRKASDEEIKFNEYLKEYLDKLRLHVDPCIPDPICHDPKYNTKLMNRFIQTDVRPFSFDAYTDETGISKRGWLLKEPVQININQLQRMRWKPRGLKECLKQPTLLKEKKLPIQWIPLPSIGSSSTHEEIENFNKTLQKRNEAEIDEKDLSEVNEMIKKIPRSEEEYNDEERKALKEKLDSMKWKHPAKETM